MKKDFTEITPLTPIYEVLCSIELNWIQFNLFQKSTYGDTASR
jgi:hypothetical protein